MQNPRRQWSSGPGFIGLEMAEALHNRGLDVSVVEMAPQVLPPFDFEMSAFVKDELEKNGIKVYTGVAASGFHNEGKTVELQNGVRLASDPYRHVRRSASRKHPGEDSRRGAGYAWWNPCG